MRELYRQEANCQIIHDSFMGRKLADPYLILVNGRVAGYGGIGNTYPPKQLTEFYTLPHMRPFALPMCRALLAVSEATHVEAQTNMPLMLLMLYDCTVNISSGVILFEDALTTTLSCPNGVFRQTLAQDQAAISQSSSEPVGDWLLDVNGAVVATGGFLTHYNPPYGDVYMEVAESERRRGYGSYLVQEVKRVCYEAGKQPAARCNLDNHASRATLQRAGMLPCGRMLVGEIDSSA
ncbi:MAG: GNAT family N-acetyltransferase [Chloroflexota bacterium]